MAHRYHVTNNLWLWIGFNGFVLIMLNLFIGIIMNSMSEMHAELDEQVRAKQSVAENDSVLSNLTALDQQLSALKSQLRDLRGKLTNNTP